MSDSVDRVFVHALNTVKRIPRNGSARPPPASRLKLYGMYKQSTEGDVEGVMKRPKGEGEEVHSDQEKWDAWNEQKGLSKTEAKRAYITTLIETMHRYANHTTDARELVSELEFVWDQIKYNPPSSSSSNSFPHNHQQGSGNGNSPTSDQLNPIYPVMSEHGARNPGARRSSKHLPTIDPISQPSSDDADEEADQDQDAGGKEEFVDAQDSQIDETADTPPEDTIPPPQTGRNFSRDASAMIAPIAKYLTSRRNQPPRKQPEDDSIKWQRRIESALIKMNAEMAALREQLDMQQDAAMRSSIFRSLRPNRRSGGFVGWVFGFVVSTASTLVKHVVLDAAVVVLVTLWMRYKGIPVERLEQTVVRWIEQLRRLTCIRRIERQVARKDFSGIPMSVARSLPFKPADFRANG